MDTKTTKVFQTVGDRITITPFNLVWKLPFLFVVEHSLDRVFYRNIPVVVSTLTRKDGSLTLDPWDPLLTFVNDS